MANHTGSSTKQRPADERFWEKVDARGDCWEWLGSATPTGYGTFFPTRNTPVRAYRYAWESLVSPIPEGMTIDHQCNNPRCVNPDHLRVLSLGANSLLGHGPAAMNARKTHCKRGHPFSGANLGIRPDGTRWCRECDRASQRARRRAA